MTEIFETDKLNLVLTVPFSADIVSEKTRLMVRVFYFTIKVETNNKMII